MVEREPLCVQQLPWSVVTGQLGKPFVLTIAVNRVTDKRVPDVFEVNTDLVCASGMEQRFDQTRFP
jgi:hypothetical protein